MFMLSLLIMLVFFFFQAEDGIRDLTVTGVQTCALPILFEAGMAIGAYFSFSGMITFKNWDPAVPLTAYPPNRLLVETDAPYLAPVPHRGKRNEPAFVRDVAAALARLRGESPDALGDRTTENARRVFGPRLDATVSPGDAP